MTAKEYLEQYAKLIERIRRLDIEILVLEAEYDSVSIDYSGMPHGSTIANKTADLAVKLSDKRLKKVRLREKAARCGRRVRATDGLCEVIVDGTERVD